MIRAANKNDNMLQQPILHLAAPNPYVASILESANKEGSMKAAIPRQVKSSLYKPSATDTRQACKGRAWIIRGYCGYAGVALAPDKQLQDHRSEWVCIPRDQCSCHPEQPSS